MTIKRLPHLFLINSIIMIAMVVSANQSNLVDMLSKIEQDTSKFAHQMESLLIDKCNFTSDETCYKASYHRCDSELPYATCPGNDYSIKECGIGSCGGLFDFTKSAVSVAPDTSNFGNEPNNDRVRDGVCSTSRLDDYMSDQTDLSEEYWSSYEVFPPWMYYGTDDG